MTTSNFANHVQAASIAALAAMAVLAFASPARASNAARGVVAINSDFAGGNVKATANTEGEVNVEPDLRGDRPWFYWCFEAAATRPGRVNFVFPEKVAGFSNGAIGFQGPAISTDQGKTWKWMGVDQVDGSSFWYDFAKADERVRFAVTIPYLQQDFDAFLRKKAANPHFKKCVLTKSRRGREVELLQIGSSGPEVKAMLVTGRHHAVESIASFVLEGFLDEAISDGPAGRAFREKYVLFAVPFVDKDGVEEGDQGKNRQPHDHNRDYGETSIYPEVQAIRELDRRHDFQFALDFHCPTLVMRDHQVMYFVGAKTHPQYNFENVSEFAKWIKQALPEAAPSGPLNWLRDESDPSPKNSRYFGFKDNAIMAATFEFPFAPPGKATDPESCRQYGRAMLRAWNATHFREPEERAAHQPENPAKPTENTSQAATAADDFAWLPLEANSAGSSPPSTDEQVVPISRSQRLPSRPPTPRGTRASTSSNSRSSTSATRDHKRSRRPRTRGNLHPFSRGTLGLPRCSVCRLDNGAVRLLLVSQHVGAIASDTAPIQRRVGHIDRGGNRLSLARIKRQALASCPKG
ncbi:MAG TPA: M14 family zinc carboxypeptidase [Pirellulaceae bacterium]|nr:M14 family zinc carboxypeptidase [Pirellulaceae bacterium]